MIRILSFKCLFLLLMIIGIGLTIGFITRITSSSLIRQPIGSSLSLKQGSKVKHGGSDFNYYHLVNDEDEEEAQANPAKNNEPARRPYLVSGGVEKSIKRGLEYPFEDADGDGGNEVSGGAKKLQNVETGEVTDVRCNINNGKYLIGCKKDSSSEVYIPFSFIQKYFEVSGKLEDPKEGGGEQVFNWHHSLAKINRPTVPYDPKGIFTYFENYNVEVRERVKCISGSEGVPVSTQWDSKGYFYPIQIAQFGLSHFSKLLTEGEPKRIILDDGDEARGGWVPDEFVSVLPNDNNDPTTNHYVQIRIPSSDGVSVTLELASAKPRMLMLSWQMHVISDREFPNVTITAKVRYESQVYYLNYVTADFLIRANDNQVYHGMGYKSKRNWQIIIRDLSVDLQKGINILHQHVKKSKIMKIMRSKLQLESVSVSGSHSQTKVQLDNLTLSTNEHLAQFYQAADWFVTHQDSRGGWPIPVRRKFGSDFYPVLEPGWYSAMGQGHALSLLARAYSATANNSHYAEACAKAVATIFDKPGGDYGVRAVFVDKYAWYEEYPTTPSSFVLNGFMYALLGLYDVKALGVNGAARKASDLYDDGLLSLKKMLPLYDTGSGTFYDLRHYTVPGISPNLARLDYHVTHINQLLIFATFEKDTIFKTVAERWIGYTEGNKASHN